MTKICVITGARSEYGLLAPLLRELKAVHSVRLQIMATGMHLAPKFGNTWKEILRDGFSVDSKVRFPLPDEGGTATSIGRATERIAAELKRLNPSVVILLGDRFESLAAAIAAYTLHIPIAHLHGGELTAGVLDEAFRHAITKMSSLHFTSTEKYRRRVIQLGEHPRTVFNVGAIGLDNIRDMELPGREQLSKELGITFFEDVACITFHPAMFETLSPAAQMNELFRALDRFPSLQPIFTLPNADKGANELIQAIRTYVWRRPGAAAYASLGTRRYLALVKLSKVVVGNSSSGIIEVPSLGVPTVNIGTRQEGRARPASVIDCGAGASEIERAIRKALSAAFSEKLQIPNPYGDGRTARRIAVTLLKKMGKLSVKKKFYDLEYVA